MRGITTIRFHRLLVAALLVAALGLCTDATAQSEGENAGTSPAAACDDLCRKLYASDAGSLTECQEGCQQAERCTTDCRRRFPDDTDKQARCNYRCARAR